MKITKLALVILATAGLFAAGANAEARSYKHSKSHASMTTGKGTRSGQTTGANMRSNSGSQGSANPSSQGNVGPGSTHNSNAPQ